MDAPDRITNLQYHMVLEYTERVERIRLGKSPTKLAVAVANYVQHHMSEAITTENIAKELYLSRPHLSSKFKEETGMTLTDYILSLMAPNGRKICPAKPGSYSRHQAKEKTEEAKRLLRYTDKTATVIGSDLGFSSQSHFSKVFKKYAGQTPTEYREQHVR